MLLQIAFHNAIKMKTLQLIILIFLLSGFVKAQKHGYEKILHGLKATVLSLENDKEGKYLCSGSYDTDLILWDYNSGKIIKKYNKHSSGIWNIKISSDNKYLACGAWDNDNNAHGSSVNCLSIIDLENLEKIKT